MDNSITDILWTLVIYLCIYRNGLTHGLIVIKVNSKTDFRVPLVSNGLKSQIKFSANVGSKRINT